MFYGEYEHAIDRKGRVIIPAKFRQALKEHEEHSTLHITRGLDGCLFLFPESVWRAIEHRLKQMPFTKSESRKFNRLFFAGAAEVACDGLGRLLMPRHLKEYAQIKQDVVVLGVSDRMEIWAKEQWKAFYDSSRQSFEETAERLILE